MVLDAGSPKEQAYWAGNKDWDKSPESKLRLEVPMSALGNELDQNIAAHTSEWTADSSTNKSL
jgi:hypothetical protein